MMIYPDKIMFFSSQTSPKTSSYNRLIFRSIFVTQLENRDLGGTVVAEFQPAGS